MKALLDCYAKLKAPKTGQLGPGSLKHSVKRRHAVRDRQLRLRTPAGVSQGPTKPAQTAKRLSDRRGATRIAKTLPQQRRSLGQPSATREPHRRGHRVVVHRMPFMIHGAA